MPVAKFVSPSGAVCLMAIREDRATALAPQELGVLIPFEYEYNPVGTSPVKWDISYLYAELWASREGETRLIIPFLPEFVTDSFRPSALRLPLTPMMVAEVEKQRRGGDLLATLHIQATLIGSVHRGQIPDMARRKALEALGVEEEIFGPIRRSDNVTLQVAKLVWEEAILPQWSAAELQGPEMYSLAGSGAVLDMTAVARSLRGATTGTEIKDILGQFRNPIVGL